MWRCFWFNYAVTVVCAVIIVIILLVVIDEEGNMRKEVVMVSFKLLTQMVANIYSSVGVVISLQTGLTRNRCSTSAKGKKSFFFRRLWWLPIRWLSGVFTARVNRPGHNARPLFTHFRLLQWLILQLDGSNNAMRLHTLVLTMYIYGLTRHLLQE